MAIVYKKERAVETLTRNSGPVVNSADVIVQTNYSAGVNAHGTFITFADGFKFRRSTALSKSVCWLSKGNGESSSFYYRPYKEWWNYSTTEGGMSLSFLFMNVDHFLDVTGVPDVKGPPSWSDSERNEAITKALVDISNTKANIGENLATLRQTMQLVRDPMGNLLKIIRSVRSNKSMQPLMHQAFRDIYRDGKGLDPIAAAYLAYVYGAKPLMQDIFGLMELAKELGNKPLLLHARAKATRSVESRYFASTDTSSGTKVNIGPCPSTSTTRVNLWAKPKPEYQLTRTLNQLGLLNPASLAWELVPFSFVIDWVLPIGPVLQALTAPAGLDFVDGSISKKLRASGPYEQYHFKTSLNFGESRVSPANGTVNYEGYRRETIRSWPRGGLWFDSDPLRLASDGSDRAFKAMALAILGLPGKR